MKLQVFILFFSVLVLAESDNQGKRCFENMTLGTSEISLTNRIKEQILNKESFDASCLHILIHRGFYKAAIILFEDYFLTNNIDLHESTLRLIQNQKRDLDKFISTTMSAKQAVQQIEPFIKWAQSQNNIFMHIKLSMRADSPACVHCKVEKVELTNSTFFMSSYGIQSHQPLRFLLNLTLFDEIDPETSTWNEDSVGTLFFNLTKVHKVILPPSTYENPSEQLNTNSTETTQQPSSDQDKQGNSSSQFEEKNNNTNSTEQGQQQLVNSTDSVTNSDDKQKETSQKEEDSTKQDSGEVNNEQVEQPIQTPTNTNTQKENISNKIWLRLEKVERKKETSIWWDMRDRYQNDMDEWDKLCAQERENKKKKTKSQQTKQSTSSNANANQQPKATQQEQQQSQTTQEEQQQPPITTESFNSETINKTDL